MENWYWDLSEIKNSPSFRAGIDNITETRYRTEGAKFISTVGQQLKLRYVTLATGTVYFHRFYMSHSFKEFHRYAIASACLFLAGKVEETPKKARDLFKQIQISGLITEQAMTSVFGDDPKESLMTLERIILKTIKFDLQVDHPYKFMLRYAKSFIGDRAKIEKVVQMGWTFINDSLCTTLCLQWEPEIIAISLMDLSCRISKHEITDWTGKPEGHRGKWWDQFVADVSMELLESICHQVLDFYSNAAPGQQAKASTSATAAVRAVGESNKRAAGDTTAQPPSKMPRADQALSQSHPAQTTQTTQMAGAPAVTSHSVSYHPPAPGHSYHHAAGYPPQSVPPQVAPSTTVSCQPSYGAPPPGYAPVYGAPPPQMSSAAIQPPPPGVYQPPHQPHAQQSQYYSQPPPTAPVHQPTYYSQAPRPAAAQYQQLPPQAYPPGHLTQQYPPPGQVQPRRERVSSLKVLTNN